MAGSPPAQPFLFPGWPHSSTQQHLPWPCAHLQQQLHPPPLPLQIRPTPLQPGRSLHQPPTAASLLSMARSAPSGRPSPRAHPQPCARTAAPVRQPRSAADLDQQQARACISLAEPSSAQPQRAAPTDPTSSRPPSLRSCPIQIRAATPWPGLLNGNTAVQSLPCRSEQRSAAPTAPPTARCFPNIAEQQHGTFPPCRVAVLLCWGNTGL